MDQNLESGDSASVVVRYFLADAFVAGLILLLGIVVVVTSLELGAGWTSDGPGSGYFPFGIGVILSISGLATVYLSLFGKNKNTEVFVDTEQLRRVLQVFIPAIIYVGGVEVFGFYIASAVYITAFMLIMGKFSIVKSLAVGLITNALFFALFEMWFKVPLFKGYVDLLTFLGYS